MDPIKGIGYSEFEDRRRSGEILPGHEMMVTDSVGPRTYIVQNDEYLLRTMGPDNAPPALPAWLILNSIRGPVTWEVKSL